MKTILSLVLTFFVFNALAQAPEAPRKEFAVYVAENALIVKPGESKQFNVAVLRSKSFAKGSVKLGLSSMLPQGVTLNFEPAQGSLETSVATLTVDPSVASSTFNLVIRGEMYSKTKATVLRVQIGAETVATK